MLIQFVLFYNMRGIIRTFHGIPNSPNQIGSNVSVYRVEHLLCTLNLPINQGSNINLQKKAHVFHIHILYLLPYYILYYRW